MNTTSEFGKNPPVDASPSCSLLETRFAGADLPVHKKAVPSALPQAAVEKDDLQARAADIESSDDPHDAERLRHPKAARSKESQRAGVEWTTPASMARTGGGFTGERWSMNARFQSSSISSAQSRWS